MGMAGRPPEMAINNPIAGQFSPETTEQMPDSMPLAGAPTTGGLDTKKGKR